MLRFNREGTISHEENRTLAGHPSLGLSFFEDCNAYLQDRFGGRRRLIRISRFVNYLLSSGKRHNSVALEGKDGWFYYTGSGNLGDFIKTNLMHEEQRVIFVEKLRKTVEWCERNNVKYLFVIAPNKHSVYPEHYPVARPEGPTRADQIVSLFSEQGINIVYSRDFLIEQKKANSTPLYYETDTHWNALGAWYGFVQIREELERLFPNVTFPSITYSRTVGFSETSGDIIRMLGITAKSTQPSLRPEGTSIEQYFTVVKNDEEDIDIVTRGTNAALPKAVIFRDSFCTALIPYLSPLFSEAEYVWKHFEEADTDFIAERKPDIVIFECVERNAPNMIEN